MLLTYFTEQPMSAYPEQQARIIADDDHPARHAGDTIVLFSNKHFDRSEASRLYQERMIEYRAVEDVGFDAVMVNEHHGGPYCMNARCNITSAALVGATERIKILQAGNPLPLWENPVQLAEEIAMLDLMSGGRIIAGMIRGGGPEQIINDVNPVYNRARFEEAHDLIIKAWTTPGPFRWDGEHYQVRVVNPWVLPLQEPHPRILVPGVSSPETIAFAASHGYPYLGLNTTLDATKKMWSYYHEVAAEAGYESGPEHRGYLMRVHVAETEEKARENAEQFMWMLGEFTGIGRPHWVAPTGYSSFDSRMARLKNIKNYGASLQSQIDAGTIIIGTPEQVVPKIRVWLEETRPGMLVFQANEGKIDHESSMKCIRLMGEEVLPALREMSKELELNSPFEADAPVSVSYAKATAGGSR
jgi:alkanesulfonate monooxygenase SsuD/methylene tetrahydromethanopterin reductase-like flavin-dependent oxidoreductase (luciferase family)